MATIILGNDPTLPVVELVIGDRTRNLVFDFGSMVIVEKLTGINLMRASSFMDQTFSDVRALLYAALLHEDPDLKIEEVGSWITPKNLPVMQAALFHTRDGSSIDPDPHAEPGSATPEDFPSGSEGSGKDGKEESLSQQLGRMWAEARYYFRLSSAEFFALTPYQFNLLGARLRESRWHVEMLHAYTTSAVYMSGMNPPEKGSAPLDWMPSHPDYKRSTATVPASNATPEQQAQKESYLSRVMQLSTEMKVYHATGVVGPTMRELKVVKV